MARPAATRLPEKMSLDRGALEELLSDVAVGHVGLVDDAFESSLTSRRARVGGQPAHGQRYAAPAPPPGLRRGGAVPDSVRALAADPPRA